MADQKVKQDEKTVGPNKDGIQDVSDGSDNAETTQSQSESGEKELQVQSEQGSGEQADDKGGSKVDFENKEETIGKKGGETVDQVIDEPKTITEKRKEIAISVFEKNPNRKVLFFTSDLIPFFEKSDAHRHAASLKDNTVVTINKE